MFNEGSCFPTHDNNKCENIWMCYVWCASSVAATIRTIPPTFNNTELGMISTYGTNSFQHNIRTALEIYTS